MKLRVNSWMLPVALLPQRAGGGYTMVESTVRAERFEPQSSTASFYVWEVPEKPISVRIPFAVIDRLEREAVESFRSLSSRGSEIGGVLLGSISPGNPAVVTIEDYEMIPCDYSRGPLYRLSDADAGRFEKTLEQRGSRVTGYFRSHTRKGLTLDAEDRAFFDPRFRDPNHLVLLIRPFAAKASTAGIFFREGGMIRGEASYREFPWRSSELGASRQGGEKTAPVRTAPAPAPPPAAARPAMRAQIVPIASRREIAMPVAPPPAATPAVKVPAEEKPPAIAPAREKPPTAMVREKAPAAATVALPAPAPGTVREKPPVTATVAPPAPAPGTAREKPSAAATAAAPTPADAPPEDATDAAEPRKGGKLWMVGAAAALVLLSGLLLFVYPGFMHRGSRGPAARQDASPLSLRVERTSGGLMLTWNRDCDAVRKATRAVLAISDGDRHENSPMDLGLLRTGSIVYSPLTGNVSFRMEVSGPDQSKATTDSLQFLDTRPSPVTDGSDPHAGTQGGAQPGAATPNPVEAANPEADQVTEVKPVGPSTPLKPFNAESLSQRLRPVRSGELPDAPALGQGTVAAPPANINAMTLSPVMPAAPPPASAASQQSKEGATGTPKAGGRFQEAQITYRKDAEYPKLARQAGAKGAVEITATIGADGKVKDVRVVKGNPMLRQAAVAAVMQWRYKPALLNGSPVDSPTQIVLNFVGDR